MKDPAVMMDIANTYFFWSAVIFGVVLIVLSVGGALRNHFKKRFEIALANYIESANSKLEKVDSFREIMTKADSGDRLKRTNSLDFNLVDGAFVLYLRDERTRYQMHAYEKRRHSHNEKLGEAAQKWREAALEQTPEKLYRAVKRHPFREKYFVLFLNHRFMEFRKETISRFAKIFEVIIDESSAQVAVPIPAKAK